LYAFIISPSNPVVLDLIIVMIFGEKCKLWTYGFEGVDWIHLAQDRDGGGNEPFDPIKGREFID
jgi:hypothetical protein